MKTTSRPAMITTTDGVAALGCTLAAWAHPDDETYLAGQIRSWNPQDPLPSAQLT